MSFMPARGIEQWLCVSHLGDDFPQLQLEAASLGCGLLAVDFQSTS